MKLLDKYILREYIKTFLIIVFAFSVLFLVVDISDRMPRLIRKGGTAEDITLYFVLRLPYLIILTSPVVVLLTGLFLMSNLSKFNESIAIRGAGISILRMVTPLFWFGIFFSVFILIIGDLTLPLAEEYRNYIYVERIKNQKVEDKKMRSNIHYLGNDGNLYFIGFFDGYRNALKTIDITSFDSDNGNIERKITSSNAAWLNEKWQFNDCYIRYFENGRLLKTKYFERTTVEELDVTPVDFIKSAKDPMSMNFFELKKYIERLKKVGENYKKELVNLYLKISFPFANFIIILFSVPLVSVSNRSRSRGLIFAIGLLVCFFYLSVLRICQSLGYNGILSPIVAAWLPNFLFFLLGIYFVVKAEI